LLRAITAIVDDSNLHRLLKLREAHALIKCEHKSKQARNEMCIDQSQEPMNDSLCLQKLTCMNTLPVKVKTKSARLEYLEAINHHMRASLLRTWASQRCRETTLASTAAGAATTIRNDTKLDGIFYRHDGSTVHNNLLARFQLSIHQSATCGQKCNTSVGTSDLLTAASEPGTTAGRGVAIQVAGW
jgi:hypothetical protein